MNDKSNDIEQRLRRLGERLSQQSSVVDRVMAKVERAAPVRAPRFNQRRILTMLLKPQSLAVAAAVLATVVFGFRPWELGRDQGAAWWLAPPSAWAGELQTAIQDAKQRGYTCDESFINQIAGGVSATSSTTNKLFVAGQRYRRDGYEEGRLRESQWYVFGADGLTLTSVNYLDKTYSIEHDPKAKRDEVDPLAQIESLAGLLEKSGRRLGTAKIDGHDAVEFEISSTAIDAQNDPAVVHAWLDQATKMPLKVMHQFAVQGGLSRVVATTFVQDHFDWSPSLPANTFEPEIPPGYAKAESK